MPEQTQLRVLLVDDEQSYIKVTALGLKEVYGMDVIVATSGQEAVNRLQA